jgi:hypothetical protein
MRKRGGQSRFTTEFAEFTESKKRCEGFRSGSQKRQQDVGATNVGRA